MDYSIGDFFSSVIKLFALLTPPAALSAFLSGTQTYGGRRKRRTALRTGTAVFIVGTVLYFFGESLFSVFGFTLDAFRIGAGALLFLTSVALMGEQRESHTPDSPDEDISVVPLAIPICMGPASIGTLMVLGASAHSMTERIIGSAALFVASALITLMLLMANHVQRILGKTGLAVLSKLTGLLLAAIAALTPVTENKFTTVVFSRDNVNEWLSVRNIPTVHPIFADQLNTYDVVTAQYVVFTKEGLEAFVDAKTKPAAKEA